MTQPHPKSSEFLYEMASRMRGRADVWKHLANRKRRQVEASKASQPPAAALDNYYLWAQNNTRLWDEFWRLSNRKMWCLLAAGRINDAASHAFRWESTQRFPYIDAP